MPKFIVVAAARPNFMKVAPLLRQFQNLAGNAAQVVLVHTGQHYDARMSDEFFRDLGIPEPDINLAVGSGTHAQQTAKVMIAFESVCLAERPDWVVVVGDVNSTLACALTAAKLGIRVAHVEAGLRSGDRSMPEEINRLCTDAISDLLFTTDRMAGENLMREGVPASRIALVGNTMIDTLLTHVERACAMPLPPDLARTGYAVVTLHRPSNVDAIESLRPLVEVVCEISRQLPVVFPVHPRTRHRLSESGLLSVLTESMVQVIEPLGYIEFLGLVARARLILTDSGGIQEETTVLGVPCLTMRENTERPITCSQGTNHLVGCDPARIRTAFRQVLTEPMPVPAPPPLWDGHASRRIVERLLHECSVPGRQLPTREERASVASL